MGRNRCDLRKVIQPLEVPVPYLHKGDGKSTVNILGVIGKLRWGIVEHILSSL